MMPMEVAADLLPGLGDQLSRLGQPDPSAISRVRVVPTPRLVSGIWSQQAALKARLLNVFPGLWHTATLDLFADILERRFGRCFSVTRYRSVVAYFFSLLDACLEQPGAMHELFDVLYSHYVEAQRSGWHGGDDQRTREIEELRQTIEKLDPKPLLTLQQRRDLYKLLDDIDFAVAADAYAAAVEPTGQPLPPYASDPVTIARELEATNASVDGLPPVLRFVEEVAIRVSAHRADDAESIQRWTDDYVEQYPALQGPILARRLGYEDGRPQARGRLALMLRLVPDPPGSQSYRLTAWLQRASAPPRSLHLYNAAYDLADLPALIDDLLNHARQPPSARVADPIVEFILPRPLLGHEFDEWRVGGVLPRRLGESLPVVVRSLERVEDSTLHGPWRIKWNWLISNGDRAESAAVHWLWDPEPSLDVLAAQVGDTPPVCLVLGFPAPAADSLGMDEVSIAVWAGMPVIVWCREDHDRADFTGLQKLLAARPLTELPDLVKSLRSATDSRPENWMGRHLTLLYDDASRIPEPDLPVRAPT